jgi:alpha-tubulin suppressor-like RCC1 family protein
MAGFHICGLDGQGAAYCWGLNSLGQLGNATLTSSPLPTLVSGGMKFYSITAGDLHTCAMTSDFAAYCWGRNLAGQLGDGTFGGGEDCYENDICRTAPVQVLFDPGT